MTISDSDIATIAERHFGEWADSRQFTIAYRSPLRRPFVAGFTAGIELGIALAGPKRRKRIEDGER